MNDLSASVWWVRVFPVLFVGTWLLVLNVLSSIGGWRELAQSYGATAPGDGKRFSFQSAKLGFVNYGGCLRFTAGTAGLFVSVVWPFRPGHHPLFIPWSNVSAVEHRGWFLRYVDLRFARQPHVRMRLSRRLAEQLIAAGGHAVRIAEAG